MGGCIDRRIVNAPRYYLCAPKDMRVYSPILRCVAFVVVRDGFDYKTCATCFFLSVDSERTANRKFYYVCTARHVTEDHLEAADWGLRVNTTTGQSVTLEGGGSKWWYHPSDDGVDFAVQPFNPNDFADQRLDVNPLPWISIAHKKIIAAEQIDVGDDVFVPGLFVPSSGSKQNLPIVRSGTIARMAGERIPWRGRMINAHLIETRSISGLSGSPVFVRGTHSITLQEEGKKPKMVLTTDDCFWCFGSMVGHWDDPETRSVNMGIGLVTPAEQMLEVLHQPPLRELRRQQEDRDLRLPNERQDDR